jgi:hypothetical protein
MQNGPNVVIILIGTLRAVLSAFGSVLSDDTT